MNSKEICEVIMYSGIILSIVVILFAIFDKFL